MYSIFSNLSGALAPLSFFHAELFLFLRGFKSNTRLCLPDYYNEIESVKLREKKRANCSRREKISNMGTSLKLDQNSILPSEFLETSFSPGLPSRMALLGSRMTRFVSPSLGVDCGCLRCHGLGLHQRTQCGGGSRFFSSWTRMVMVMGILWDGDPKSNQYSYYHTFYKQSLLRYYTSEYTIEDVY